MDETNKKSEAKWFISDVDTIYKEFNTSTSGVNKSERDKRISIYGENTIPAPPPDTLLTIFIKQFQSPLIYLLLVAASFLAFVDEYIDAGIIGFVLLFNAVAGTVQAGRAQNTMRALQKISTTMATVKDGAELVVIEDKMVVPGDIIVLREGDKVPADARLIKCVNLRVNESPLTGESKASAKDTEHLSDENLPPVDQKNMVFKGTLVVAGTAEAVVVGTGKNTFIGSISQQISEIHTKIPLQVSIEKLSHIIIIVVVSISAFIFGFGYFLNQDIDSLFKLSIAVIVSAVPEGLPIVLTLLLATGVWRMGKRNVLVKRMQAVEALGEAKVIAVDKTGTITKNELAVSVATTGDSQFQLETNGFEAKGAVLLNGDLVTDFSSDLTRLGVIASLSADAEVVQDEETGLWDTHGDPTDGAMLVFAQKLGLEKKRLLADYSLIEDMPFDATLKYHASYYQNKSEKIILVAGAAEEIIRLSSKVLIDGVEVELTDEKKQSLLTEVATQAGKALRVIGLAQRSLECESLSEEYVQDLTFVGLVGMIDGLRAEVPEAMERTREAGIKVVMITGDHKDTAQAIAADAGIYKPGDTVITNSDIDAMSEEELIKAVKTTTVFARITPEHKLSIIQALRANGDIVAMTGDGVNDALSLVAADLGVAMGKRGTEVAKEAADLILLDDNFGSIVSAVEEGRGIYVNLKKVLLFLFSTSIGEVVLIILAIALALPSPVLAAQLIWINLVTDGVLDVGLAMESKEKGLLKRNFVKPNSFFIDKWMFQRMMILSLTMALVTLAVFYYYYQLGELALAMTMAVTVLAVTQWFKAWSCRTEYRSVFEVNVFTNKYLLYGTFVVIGLHVFAVYNPFMQGLLTLEPLTLNQWILAIVVSSSVLWFDELRKYIYRRRHETIPTNQ